jgi:hypothetical protein
VFCFWFLNLLSYWICYEFSLIYWAWDVFRLPVAQFLICIECFCTSWCLLNENCNKIVGWTREFKWPDLTSSSLESSSFQNTCASINQYWICILYFKLHPSTYSPFGDPFSIYFFDNSLVLNVVFLIFDTPYCKSNHKTMRWSVRCHEKNFPRA